MLLLWRAKEVQVCDRYLDAAYLCDLLTLHAELSEKVLHGENSVPAKTHQVQHDA